MASMSRFSSGIAFMAIWYFISSERPALLLLRCDEVTTATLSSNSRLSIE